MRVGFIILAAVLLVQCARNGDVLSDLPAPSFSAVPDSILNHAADSLQSLGDERYRLRAFDSATFFYRAALSLRNARGYEDMRTSLDHWKIGRVLSTEMQSEAAFQSLNEARRIAEANSASLDTLVRLYLNMAEVKRELFDFATATSLALHALSSVRQHDPGNQSLLARCYRSLGLLQQFTGDYHESISNYRRAMALIESSDSAMSANLCLATAVSYGKAGVYDSSLIYLDRMLRVAPAVSTVVSDYPSTVYLNKGKVFAWMGIYDSARFYMQKSLWVRQDKWGEKHLLTAGAYEGMGDLYDSLGFLDSALYCRHNSLRSLIREFNDESPLANPRPAKDEMTMDLVDYLVMKGNAAHKIATRETDNLQMGLLAVDTYLLADSVNSQVLANEAFDDPQIRHLEFGRIPYGRMMELTMKLHTATGDGAHLERALRIMERSKAFILKKAVTRLESFAELGIDPELLRKQNRLKEQRSILVQSLMINQHQLGIRDSIAAAIVRLNDNYRNLQKEIDSQRPSEFLDVTGAPISVHDLMKEMRSRRSQWIEYLWSGNTIYVLSISPQRSALLSIPVTTDLLDALDRVTTDVRRFDETKAIKKSNFTRMTNDLLLLYGALVEPVIDKTQKALVISPSGSLTILPFEALITSAPLSDEVDFRLPYLVNEYDISYQYSSSLVNRHSTKRQSGNRLLGVAYSAADKDSTNGALPDLPGSRAELEAIRQIMSGPENIYMTDGQASEAEFKNRAEDANLLHLAIHGVSDTSNAMNSRLVFANAGSEYEDGVLYAHELYALDLRNVELAVLSACESGIGKMQSGEGMMSIARGFAYSGCPSLVVSIWKVSDQLAPSIMSDFYMNLSDGVPIDVSLGNAKRNYLKSTNVFNAHPFFWAAFLTVGETSAVTTSDGSLYAIVIIIATVGALAFLVWMRSIKRHRRALVSS